MLRRQPLGTLIRSSVQPRDYPFCGGSANQKRNREFNEPSLRLVKIVSAMLSRGEWHFFFRSAFTRSHAWLRVGGGADGGGVILQK